jgi:hypothetical protein
MDSITLHTELGLELPGNMDFFKAVHSKIAATGKLSIYEFLSMDTHSIPATTLAFKAKAAAERYSDAWEKEICSEIVAFFSGSEKDANKSSYDLYLSFLSVNKTFEEIASRIDNEGTDALSYPEVCTHFVGKLTDALSIYPSRPNSTDIFERFCGINGYKYSMSHDSANISVGISDGEAIDDQPKPPQQSINLKSIITEMRHITADMINNYKTRRTEADNAAKNNNELQKIYLAFEDKKPLIDAYLVEWIELGSNWATLTIDVSTTDDEENEQGESNQLSSSIAKVQNRVSSVFDKTAQPIGGLISKRIGAVDGEPLRNLDDIRVGMSSAEAHKHSLQSLCMAIDELFGGKEIIFDECDAHISGAEEQLNRFDDVTMKATNLCEDADAKNKVADLIPIDAQRTLKKISELSEQAKQYSLTVKDETGSVMEITVKYTNIVNDIKRKVDEVEQKNAEAYRNLADSVNTQVNRFRNYNLIGIAVFAGSLAFSIPQVVKIIVSLFTFDFSWQDGRGVFIFMLIFILLVPVAFMFFRSHVIKFVNQGMKTISKMSLSLESGIDRFSEFKQGILNSKDSFASRGKIFEFAIILNFMLCSVSFAIYVIMMIISFFVD